jgi:antitoxin CptB
MHTDPAAPARIASTDLSRLKWRCRRGLLENDLFIERFFARYEAGLSQRHADGLQALMDLADNDLLDLLLARREPDAELARPEVLEVLGMLRAKPAPVSVAPDLPTASPEPAIERDCP